MKERLRNWVTTIIGAMLMLAAVVMYIVSKFYPEMDIHATEIAMVAVLGWVFLWAKNSLIEGMFLNLFKIKEPREPREL